MRTHDCSSKGFMTTFCSRWDVDALISIKGNPTPTTQIAARARLWIGIALFDPSQSNHIRDLRADQRL
jgi:hypothetical protein